MGIKLCNKCKVEKPISSFDKNSAHKSGHTTVCKICRAVQRKKHRTANKEKYDLMKKKYRDANPEKYARWAYKSKHGFYKEDMEVLLQKQGNVCKICGTDNPGRMWVIDHNHDCCPIGKTCPKCRRGILCDSCNKMLGFAYDKPEILAKAVEYLEEYERSK